MPSAAGLTQMITIVDKSNKVVGSSKQLKNVFSEAKVAYLERRAEIKAQRKIKEEAELQRAIRAVSIADEEERGSTVSRSRTHRSSRHQEPSRHRRYSDEYSPRELPREPARESSRSPVSPAGYAVPVSVSPRTPTNLNGQPQFQMIRRSQTEMQLQPRRPVRINSAPDVDLDLAYGEYHDEDLRSLSFSRTHKAATPQQQEKQLGTLVQKCQFLLDEANCAQYSARKIVMHLQNNPDAMAAVALTLAEISNIASKLAPSALTAFKTSAPAVLGLLASPQFLIAVGVGLGVTVVMFGGYKIIKKIQAGPGNSDENLTAKAKEQLGSQGAGMDEAIDVRELDRIEQWRRGIADSQTERLILDDGRTEVSEYSAATSVEGEFISPFAAQSMGHLPLPAKPRGHQQQSRSKKDRPERERERESSDGRKKISTSRRHRDRDGERSTARDRAVHRDDESQTSKTSLSRSFTAPPSTMAGNSSRKKDGDKNKQIIKVKKPSPLRRMFTGTSVKS